jgi:hypothetical protein
MTNLSQRIATSAAARRFLAGAAEPRQLIIRTAAPIILDNIRRFEQGLSLLHSIGAAQGC